MRRHPETKLLLEVPQDAYSLDMGAGDGSSGCSVMIDIDPKSDAVMKADMLDLPFDDCTFDYVLSQCAFYVSGNPGRAMEEAMRVLKPGGKLMLTDIFFSEPDFPYDEMEDCTPQWREYYLERLWSDDGDCPEMPEDEKGKPRYYQIVRTKE